MTFEKKIYTSEECNKRFHYLRSLGIKEFNIDFDRPTEAGYDSDHTMADGKVGASGVAIDSILDMQTLFEGISLAQVSTSMTTNASGFILLAFYIAIAKQQGADLRKLHGTIQNDILKEFAVNDAGIYPPVSSMRIITDMLEWCGDELPQWNTITTSGYHFREAGCSAIQELAFSLSNGKAYAQAAVGKDLNIDAFGKRLSFLFSAHNNLFEEVAKFRAAKRIWAKIMNGLGATDPEAMKMTFHARTFVDVLNVQQQPDNIPGVTIQALASVLGGTKIFHINDYDESLSLSIEKAVESALRTQQLITNESIDAESVDLLAGSYYVEALTEEIAAKSWELIEKIDLLGGSLAAIKQGFIQAEIAKNSDKLLQQLDKNKVGVGPNQFQTNAMRKIPELSIENSVQKLQIKRLEELRRRRDPARCDSLLQELNDKANSDENIMPAVIEAAENFCTLGEIADTLREVFGAYKQQ